MTVVGFTGTQKGITSVQRRWLMCRLRALRATELHHGDCIGADEVAHDIARSLGLYIVVHPPIDERKRAFLAGDVVLEPGPYLDRDHDIVNACNVLLATPRGREIRRSGTWATVRYARRSGCPVEMKLP